MRCSFLLLLASSTSATVSEDQYQFYIELAINKTDADEDGQLTCEEFEYLVNDMMLVGCPPSAPYPPHDGNVDCIHATEHCLAADIDPNDSKLTEDEIADYITALSDNPSPGEEAYNDAIIDLFIKGLTGVDVNFGDDLTEGLGEISPCIEESDATVTVGFISPMAVDEFFPGDRNLIQCAIEFELGVRSNATTCVIDADSCTKMAFKSGSAVIEAKLYFSSKGAADNAADLARSRFSSPAAAEALLGYPINTVEPVKVERVAGKYDIEYGLIGGVGGIVLVLLIVTIVVAVYVSQINYAKRPKDELDISMEEKTPEEKAAEAAEAVPEKPVEAAAPVTPFGMPEPGPEEKALDDATENASAEVAMTENATAEVAMPARTGCCSTGCCSIYAIRLWSSSMLVGILGLIVSAVVLAVAMGPVESELVCLIDGIYELEEIGKNNTAVGDVAGELPTEYIDPIKERITLLDVMVILPAVIASVLLAASSALTFRSSGYTCASKVLAAIAYIFLVLSFIMGALMAGFSIVLNEVDTVNEFVQIAVSICDEQVPQWSQSLTDSIAARDRAAVQGLDTSDYDTEIAEWELAVVTLDSTCDCTTDLFNLLPPLVVPGIAKCLFTIYLLISTITMCCSAKCCSSPFASPAKPDAAATEGEAPSAAPSAAEDMLQAEPPVEMGIQEV